MDVCMTSTDTVIKVENISKRYFINKLRESRHLTLRDKISDSAISFGARLLEPFGYRKVQDLQEEFWALKNVSLEIKQGEHFAIIGGNGAGKSSFLKILSRVTEPTTGRIEIKGRLTSLLEVGTGFHPEMTGRENIFFSGIILGMSKASIQKKFDEIVDFADIGKFLDTPVKKYSSGMYVRLAFSVAVHLDPDILVLDEVLSVGDLKFQEKCFDKMWNDTTINKTIILVSHNLQTIEKVCTRGLYLKSGEMVAIGPVSEIIDLYKNS
jgi:lipopolysaccharide transport system ATP-binding protein